MLGGRVRVGEGSFNPILQLFCCRAQPHFPELVCQLDGFCAGSFLAFLSMDSFYHHRYGLHLVTRSDREDISVEMNRTTLIMSIRKYFRNGFKHSEIFITDDFTASIVADTNGNEDRNVLDFTTPAAFQIDAINIDI